MERNLKQFLDSKCVHYKAIAHYPTFTALATAHSAHVAEKELAKTVMLRVDGSILMVVVPASHNVNLQHVRNYVDAETVELADEYEFEELFPDCQPGAMPALGNLYGIEVLCADALLDDEEIAFNAGTHDEVVKMKFPDFVRLTKPLIGRISEPREAVQY
jgi:Ala-tRNA(Pro) deacylase